MFVVLASMYVCILFFVGILQKYEKKPKKNREEKEEEEGEEEEEK